MLQHSRAGSEQKEPTDINLLADEYLRLAYHGARAKERSFNAKIETDFDGSIRKIDIVPQEIGRVSLTWSITNYMPSRETAMSLQFTLTTRKLNDKIERRVADNGNGIPKRYWIKYFSHSLQQNQPARQQAWV